jgi:hypothetical protein
MPREKVIELSEAALDEVHGSLQKRIVGGSKALSPPELVQLTSVVDSVITNERSRTKRPVDAHPEVQLAEFVNGKKDLDMGSVLAKTNQMGFQDGWFPPGQYHDLMFIPQQLILEQAVTREMTQALYYRTKESSLITLSMTAPDSITYLSPEEGRLRALAYEMTTYGVDAVGAYYDTIKLMRYANSAHQLDDIAHRFDMAIKNMSMDRARREELLTHARKFASEQEVYIHRATAADSQRIQLKQDIKANAEEMQSEFDRVWDDFTFFTPEEEKTFLHDVPKVVLDLGIKARKMVDVVSFHRTGSMMSQVVKEGMHFRTGRADVLAQYHTKEASLAGDKEYRQLSERFTKKYIERVRDEYLMSEAAGFEFVEKIKPAESADTNALVLQTMKTLIAEHRPKTDKDIHFTLLAGENMMRKIRIKFHKDMPESEVEVAIRDALKRSAETPVTAHNGKELSHKDRVDLGFLGYSTKRVKDRNYQHIYGTGQKDKQWGDYLIQVKRNGSVGDYMEDAITEHSPESMFAVDSHTTAVLIDERQKLVDGTVKTVIRYNHSKFDGIQARTHAKRILDNLTVQSLTSTNIHLTTAENAASLIPSDETTYPQLEGIAYSLEEGVSYPKITLTPPGSESPITLSPSFTRSFILALANDVTTYHHLHAGDKSKWEFYKKYGDRFDDVQPITTLLSHIDRQMKVWKKDPSKVNTKLVQEWFGRYDGAKKRAEKSHSDSMLSAAIVGRYEKAVVAIGSTINKGISAYSSPGSMLSPLPRHRVPENPEYHRELFFTTAQAMSYARQKIDLLHPEKSMGVVGYTQEGTSAMYTCRKMPCQAQVEIRDAILQDILPSDASEEMTKNTLLQFNTLVKSWDGLMKGKADIADFLKTRKKVFKALQDDEICGSETLAARQITSENELQAFLNRTLQKAAEQVLDKQKIEQTKKDFEAFMQASGVQVAYSA